MSSNELAVVTLSIVLLIVVLAGGPLLTIWALNTLFATGIAYSLKTWFATLWLQVFAVGTAVRSSNKK